MLRLFEMFSLQAVVSALKASSIAEPGLLDKVRAAFSSPSCSITLGNVARTLKHAGLQDSIAAAVLRYLLVPFALVSGSALQQLLRKWCTNRASPFNT